MKRADYFLKAANYTAANKPWTKKHWVISLLAITYEEEGAFANDPYPYRIVRKDDKIYFLDPEKNGEFTEITTKAASGALFTPESLIRLKANDLPSVTQPMDVCFGDLLYNVIVMKYAFDDKIPFLVGPIVADKVEALIELKLVDNPTPAKPDIPDKALVVDEYLKFTKAMMQLQGYNYLFVPSASPKTLTRDPRIPEKRKELLAKYADRLHDPAVAAEIDKVLIKMDREWVDDDGKDFYIKSKSYDNARKKTLLVHGYEKPFSDSDDPVYIPTALSEGMDWTKMKVYANSIREGSYNRGNETMLGGVEAKKAFRNYQNSFIVMEDCGSKLGLLTYMGPSLVKKAVKNGLYFNSESGPVRITDENSASLINKMIPLRSPMVCAVEHTDYCAVCMGAALAESPDALGAAAAGVGSGFLLSFMKMMHVTNVKTVEYNMLECIN